MGREGYFDLLGSGGCGTEGMYKLRFMAVVLRLTGFLFGLDVGYVQKRCFRHMVCKYVWIWAH